MAIRRLLGASVGDAKYQQEADSDLDGDIDFFDYLECRRNVFDAVNMFQPPMLATSPAAAKTQSDAVLAPSQLGSMVNAAVDQFVAIGVDPFRHDLISASLHPGVRRFLGTENQPAIHGKSLTGGEYTSIVDELFAARRVFEEGPAVEPFTSGDTEVLGGMAPSRNGGITQPAVETRTQTPLPGKSAAADAPQPELDAFDDLLESLARDKVESRVF